MSRVLKPRPTSIAQAKRLIQRKSTVAGISTKELLDGGQTGALVAVRKALCWELRYIGKLSLPQIGRLLNIHHTTVLHHCKAEAPEARQPINCPDLSGEWAI